MSEQETEPPAKLRWRCRRGMQELDVMLERWLERAWPAADERHRQAFSQLLGQEDDLLWGWLSGRASPPVQLADVVREIRELGFGNSGC